EAYRRALAIAHSDDTLYAGECARLYWLVSLDADHGSFHRERFDQAVTACDHALAVNADNSEALERKTDLYLALTSTEAEQGRDSSEAARVAIEVAAEAVRKRPAWDSWLALGRALTYNAEKNEALRGLDTRPSLRRAVDALERSRGLRSTGKAERWLGLAYALPANAASERGEDPVGFFGKSTQAYRRGIEVDSDDGGY